MQEPFGGERFSYSLLLVLCNRVVTVIVAAGLLVANGQGVGAGGAAAGLRCGVCVKRGRDVLSV